MARQPSKRKSDVSSKSSPPTSSPPTSSAPTEDALEMKVVAMAEEMGRLIAAVQTKTERWLDQASVRDQLTRIHEGAAELISHLTPAGAPAAQAAKAKEKGRSGGVVDAPGKKHRSAPPTVHGA